MKSKNEAYPLAFFFSALGVGLSNPTPIEYRRGRKYGLMMINSYKSWKAGVISQGHMFAKVGFLWSLSECILEGYRGRTDVVNIVTAACITGSILSYGSGPYGMISGCVGFTAFALVIESAMEYMSQSHQ
eukprot:TRINITY_DN524_c0_g1_i3.p1 TRINITY_DN524_c0_g1~~TRINITY_DN524_c0_g1_i3.p1  ORF type:complete len:130 (-),score=21.73 TRINITY_DN524_c0_g1_i3:249-638(-)